ncbi:MAG: hypothetical protein DYG83_03460 [Candidatus Brocadia sp. AMX2]|nr:MAG: hypothetical protein EDM70_00075 [Candidatus Brocadia sp. AMX2]KXK30967.1 MAG: hypothetical protein UZ01_01088 [Candidatus Brocadia sinica]MBL1168552.1 hypothetical protein [Candidatus Brocadia sp. AMX1]MCE7865881.1 hypothetical protein [Candidatus Brocadia sp. AMX2]
MDKMRKIGFYLISTLIYKQMWQQVGPNPVIVSSTEWHNGNHKSYFFRQALIFLRFLFTL